MAKLVCLIIPPSGFLLDERVFMPLGILRVAAMLEREKIPVEVLDLSGVSNYLEAIADYAAATKIRIFGLTATTPQLPAATAIAKVIRDIQKNARLICVVGLMEGVARRAPSLNGETSDLANALFWNLQSGGGQGFSARYLWREV